MTYKIYTVSFGSPAVPCVPPTVRPLIVHGHNVCIMDAMALCKRLRGIAFDHTLAGQWNTLFLKPRGSVLMTLKLMSDTQNCCEPSFAWGAAITNADSHVANYVVDLKSGSKLTGPAQTRNGRKFVLKVGFPTNRTINKRIEAMFYGGESSDLVAHQK